MKKTRAINDPKTGKIKYVIGAQARGHDCFSFPAANQAEATVFTVLTNPLQAGERERAICSNIPYKSITIDNLYEMFISAYLEGLENLFIAYR